MRSIHGLGQVPVGPQEELVPLDKYTIPGLGPVQSREDGAEFLVQTRDRRLVLLCRPGATLAYLPTEVGVPACYPLEPAALPRKIKAVLMDLDGTSVHSEAFWIWVIRSVTARLLGDESFELAEADMPYVSGYSVSEHLDYCLKKYLSDRPGATLERARAYYFEIVHAEMKAIMEGRGRPNAFTPAPRLKEFLAALKSRGVKIGLITSGLYEKAWPEIKNAFDTLDMGDPVAFYDGIITAGDSIRPGQSGTLGELEAKPHPWLYAEVLHALGVSRDEAVGIEDSSAGVISIRLAGLPALGVDGGNLAQGGEAVLCQAVAPDLWSLWETVIQPRV